METSSKKDSNSQEPSGYERLLLIKPQVYVYKIPPVMSANLGFRASNWDLANPNWCGRIRVISIDDSCFIYIEDGTDGKLYAKVPVESYPGPEVQQVIDSSRYFVVKVVSDTGRTALVGIGFADSSDAFDLNVALRDHFNTLEHTNRDSEDQQADNDNRPKLDLSLKSDITVKLNIGLNRNLTSSKSNNTSNQKRQVSIRNANEEGNANIPILLPPPPTSASSRNRNKQ